MPAGDSTSPIHPPTPTCDIARGRRDAGPIIVSRGRSWRGHPNAAMR